jgi:hypothetical protein
MDPLATTTYPAGNVAYNGPAQSPTVSVGDWLVTYLISFVPVIGFIMLFVWAFSSSTPPSKANWAKAALVVMVIFMVLGGLFASSLMALLMSTRGHSTY